MTGIREEPSDAPLSLPEAAEATRRTGRTFTVTAILFLSGAATLGVLVNLMLLATSVTSIAYLAVDGILSGYAFVSCVRYSRASDNDERRRLFRHAWIPFATALALYIVLGLLVPNGIYR